MDYREYSKDRLSRKKHLASAYASLNAEIEMLEREKTACKIAASNIGGENPYEERLINVLADLEDCRFRRSVVERELIKIEKGMNVLDDYHRDVIEHLFIERESDAVEYLMTKWFKERSTVYRDRNRALEDFTRSIYGVVQL